MGSLIAFDKLSNKLEIFFENIDKNKIVRFIWKIFYSLYTIINICTEPINNIITNFIKNKFSLAKNIFNKISLSDNSNDIDIDNIIDNDISLSLNKSEESKFSNYLNSSKADLKSKSKSKSKSILESESNSKVDFSDHKVNEIIEELKSSEQVKSEAVIEKQELFEKLSNITDFLNTSNTTTDFTPLDFTENDFTEK